MPITATSPFKGRHFPGEVIVLCVGWYLRYPLAYDHVSELLAARGVAVDPSCIWRLTCVLLLLKSQVPDFHFASLRNWQPGPAQPECQELHVGGWFDRGEESRPAFGVSSDDVSRAEPARFCFRWIRRAALSPFCRSNRRISLWRFLKVSIVLFTAPTGTATFAPVVPIYPTSGAPAAVRRLGGRASCRTRGGSAFSGCDQLVQFRHSVVNLNYAPSPELPPDLLTESMATGHPEGCSKKSVTPATR